MPGMDGYYCRATARQGVGGLRCLYFITGHLLRSGLNLRRIYGMYAAVHITNGNYNTHRRSSTLIHRIKGAAQLQAVRFHQLRQQ